VAKQADVAQVDFVRSGDSRTPGDKANPHHRVFPVELRHAFPREQGRFAVGFGRDVDSPHVEKGRVFDELFVGEQRAEDDLCVLFTQKIDIAFDAGGKLRENSDDSAFRLRRPPSELERELRVSRVAPDLVQRKQ